MSAHGEGPPSDTIPCDQAVTIPALVQESFRGSFLASCVATPKLSAFGTDPSAVEDLSDFLEKLFAQSRPDAWTRLRLPRNASLRHLVVAIDRDDLARSNRSEVPVEFPAVFIPADDGSCWVMVPTLHHTVHVAKDENAIEVVQAEIQRVVAAQDLNPWDLVGLLPAKACRLESITVPLIGPDAKGMRDLAAAAKRKRAVETLQPVATALHVERQGWKLPPLVGRDEQLRSLTSLLDAKVRTSVLLCGPSQSGMSALSKAWIATTGRLVYQTSGARLVAGMSGLGAWEQRAHDVMNALAELDAVLYLEDLQDLLAERAEGGGFDVAAALRPYLQEGKVRLLAEVRSDRADDLERRNWAIFSALTRIAVEPLSAADTRTALTLRVEHDAEQDPDAPRFEPAALDAIVELADRYQPYDAFPGKAMRQLLDLRGAFSTPGVYDPGKAAIGRGDVYDSFARSTGLPVALLRDDIRLRVGEVVECLQRELIGQDDAVRVLAETIAVVKARLQPASKPLATFLFVGPTGVGKTELARALARFLFGSQDRLARFDMSEYMTPDAAERLIRGTDSADGLLTRRVREQPFCVLLLDEIEKADPAVFDLLLQVCGEGRLTDARGHVAWFHNTIIIMTSNLGARERRDRAGFGDSTEPDLAHYSRLVHGTFRPEFVNRIDRIVPFAPLAREQILEVATIAVGRLALRPGIVDRGIRLDVSELALQRLAQDGFDVRYGARALRRQMDEAIVAPLARLLAEAGEKSRDGSAVIRTIAEKHPPAAQTLAATHGDRFSITLLRSDKAAVARQDNRLARVSELRRLADGYMRLPTVEEVHDQVAELVAQLASDASSRDVRIQQELAELRSEYQRLAEVWEPVHDAFDELLTLEELALFSILTGEAGHDTLPEARAAFDRLTSALPYVLLALEPRRNEIALILEEIDPGSFDPWLHLLLEELERRPWTVQLHIDGGARVPSDDWPAGRRWGPPRSPAEVLSMMRPPAFRNVLLRCRGKYAVLLGLEAGLHVLINPPRRGESPEADEGRVFVHLVALDFDLDDRQWEHSALTPPKPTTAPKRRRASPVRELDWGSHEVRLLSKLARLPMDPSSYFEKLEHASFLHLVALEREQGGLQRQDALLPGISPDEA